jgi:hypothetical protein|tara:strand:+ start:230 stop:418 length:189 start_codon:yes stop_codon:yes gene_type:complete
MKNTWAYIYGDECDELWDHFGMSDRNNNDRMKIKFVEFESEEEQFGYNITNPELIKEKQNET